jgi:thymidine kinase
MLYKLNQNNKMFSNTGRIELIIGCMYSGKTSEMIRRIQMYKTLNIPIAIYTHCSDTRYAESGNICTHNRNTIEGCPVTNLESIRNLEDYKEAKVVFIEEAQFFADLFDTVCKCANTDNKIVIISGLDGDFQLKPFEQIMRLIPCAETVVKLNALCKKCGDGTVASFSKRIVNSQERELVGSDGIYEAVCRKHYFAI